MNQNFILWKIFDFHCLFFENHYKSLKTTHDLNIKPLPLARPCGRSGWSGRRSPAARRRWTSLTGSVSAGSRGRSRARRCRWPTGRWTPPGYVSARRPAGGP